MPAAPPRPFVVWSTRPASRSTLAAIALALSVALGATAAAVADRCGGAVPPLARRAPGTPLDGYCSAVEGPGFAIVDVVGPLLVLVLGAALLRRRVGPVAVLALVVGLLAVANLVVADGLRGVAT